MENIFGFSLRKCFSVLYFHHFLVLIKPLHGGWSHLLLWPSKTLASQNLSVNKVKIRFLSCHYAYLRNNRFKKKIIGLRRMWNRSSWMERGRRKGVLACMLPSCLSHLTWMFCGANTIDIQLYSRLGSRVCLGESQSVVPFTGTSSSSAIYFRVECSVFPLRWWNWNDMIVMLPFCQFSLCPPTDSWKTDHTQVQRDVVK